MKPVCTHCERRKPNSTRGLCRTCTDTPGVRDMYPPKSRAARLHRNGYGYTGSYTAPTQPTTAPRGSEEKIRAMSERARLGLALFHPDDNPDAGDLARLYATPLTADTTNEEDAA